MMRLLYKEYKLAASPLTWFFLAGTLLALVPGYPILLSAFFVCLGIFHSFQSAREANDVLYTVLLPVRKSDVPAAKYAFTASVQMIAFALTGIWTAVRMGILSGLAAYENNPLLTANLTFLAFVLLMDTTFNLLFLRGFFSTAYKLGKPMIAFIAAAMALVAVSETLHHVPGLEWLNGTAGADLARQTFLLIGAAGIYAAGTLLSLRSSRRAFEKVDF